MGTVITSVYKAGCAGSCTFSPQPLEFPSTYTTMYIAIGRVDQGTDLDESQFSLSDCFFLWNNFVT